MDNSTRIKELEARIVSARESIGYYTKDIQSTEKEIDKLKVKFDITNTLPGTKVTSRAGTQYTIVSICSDTDEVGLLYRYQVYAYKSLDILIKYLNGSGFFLVG